ncbi:hypothetical protein BHE74_00044707 [Ensete ventricosum]|nr:hypothetical protein BHE74_00044707 [Ensete ventricosum]
MARPQGAATSRGGRLQPSAPVGVTVCRPGCLTQPRRHLPATILPVSIAFARGGGRPRARVATAYTRATTVAR